MTNNFEHILGWLMFGFGIEVAIILFLRATFSNPFPSELKMYVLLAFIALFLQNGCWYVAVELDRMTKGRGDDFLYRGMGFVYFVALIWSLLRSCGRKVWFFDK